MPVNEPAAPRARRRRRAEIAARIPRGYCPALHLATPTALGVVVLAAAVRLLDAVEPVELLAVPATLLLGLAFEWWAHRSVLHRRAPLLGALCERHEREHHLAFTADDMALRSARELWLVLTPPGSALLVLALLLPIAAAAGLLLSPDAALLGLATAMGLFVSYEWLHLAYHLPPDSPVYRVPGLARLREHHRRHHDPRLMKRWNFNVTVPVFDLVRGTLWSPRPRGGA
ncbi:sterol desaturase family protein [Sorangium sp. So ce1182]|uniref:sterol desaturase family protein n=1 Tax=Sorangium sp. So ce1182 TaxID=3133334 RepID=UPI003F6044E3